MSGSVQWGQGERRRGQGAGVRRADRRTTGGIDAVRGQGCYAHARAGAGCDARTFRLVLGLLARREHQDEVDPAGLEVRGQGEGPDPADHCTLHTAPGHVLGSAVRNAVVESCALA